jgi:hypothetical protein
VSVFKRDNEFLPKCVMCWWEVIWHGQSKSETDRLSCYDNDGIKIYARLVSEKERKLAHQETENISEGFRV